LAQRILKLGFLPMRCVLSLLLIFHALVLVGGEAPTVLPSPSTVSGERIWQPPRLTHWPAVVYADEERNCSFELPVKKAGVAGAVGWEGGEQLPIVLPDGTDRVSGLLSLPRAPGAYVAHLTIADVTTNVPLRIADVREPWPFAGLRDGFPIDDKGVPVVLVDRRRDPTAERTWTLLATSQPRGTGPSVVVGDPLADMGGDAWSGVNADCRIAVDDRHPEFAVLVALASLAVPVPRTLVWCPGNGALFSGGWTGEEERIIGAIRSRCAALGAQPRFVLVLPPIPLDPELKALADERRDLLARSAGFQGWTVLDAEQLAGPADKANRVAEGLFTRHPIGEARTRIRDAIATEVKR